MENIKAQKVFRKNNTYSIYFTIKLAYKTVNFIIKKALISNSIHILELENRRKYLAIVLQEST